MNRNELYQLLKELGMYPLFVRRGKDRYHTRFVLNHDEGQHECHITTEWGYISYVEVINLYANEVKIEGRLTDMTININYKDIKKFEVEIFDEEDCY